MSYTIPLASIKRDQADNIAHAPCELNKAALKNPAFQETLSISQD